jgi:anti-sigma regulatory factor (Ser/Thr protein kinase)
MGPLTPARPPAAHQRYPVRTEEDAGAARRAAGRMAEAAGISPADVQLAAAELASNIVRHAGGDGYLLCQAGAGYLELIAADHGPGLGAGSIPSAAAVPRPHVPGSGSGLGVGLGAVRRLAAAFDWYSGPDGTVILARFGEPRLSRSGFARWGAVNVPLGGAGDSGDSWLVAAGEDGHLTVMVADGLGHGPAAAAASAAAVSAVAAQPASDPGLALARAHEAMRGTRGGVLGIAMISPAAGELAWAGAGNIAGWLLHGGRRDGLLSREGTAGTQARPPRPHVIQLPWPAGATLILASDGMRTMHHLDSLAGLRAHDPSVAAAVLHRDHERKTDDACVLVVQDTRAGQ